MINRNRVEAYFQLILSNRNDILELDKNNIEHITNEAIYIIKTFDNILKSKKIEGDDND